MGTILIVICIIEAIILLYIFNTRVKEWKEEKENLEDTIKEKDKEKTRAVKQLKTRVEESNKLLESEEKGRIRATNRAEELENILIEQNKEVEKQTRLKVKYYTKLKANDTPKSKSSRTK